LKQKVDQTNYSVSTYISEMGSLLDSHELNSALNMGSIGGQGGMGGAMDSDDEVVNHNN